MLNLDNHIFLTIFPLFFQAQKKTIEELRVNLESKETIENHLEKQVNSLETEVETLKTGSEKYEAEISDQVEKLRAFAKGKFLVVPFQAHIFVSSCLIMQSHPKKCQIPKKTANQKVEMPPKEHR